MSPFYSIGNWFHGVWFGYFWPSLQGNGPEDLLSYLVIGGGVVWLGKKLLAEWREHKAKVDAEHALLHEKIDAGHAMIQHVITQHPGIDNHVPGLAQKYQPDKSRST